MALQCLNVSLQYEPGNEDYRKKVEEIKELQSKKAKSNVGPQLASGREAEGHSNIATLRC